ncbi:MAG: homoserine kinase [Flavobacteriaceae bacterium]
MNSIKVFSPATIANLSCGFDVLGLCLDYIGDEMIIRKTTKKGVFITKMEGYNLPLDAHKNAAGASALALLNEIDLEYGFEIEIIKKVKPGSGIGSSASSAAGSVVGINHLLSNPFSKKDLIRFAMEGERAACGSPIADNVSPAILGGFTLVKSANPLEVISLPTPDDLFVVILHPQIEIKTADSRAVLPKTVPLTDAVKQWANVGSLVSALYENNYPLIARSLTDVVIEPYRSKLIPFFNEVKAISLQNGSLGCGISGSGPSIFSICKGENAAEKVALELTDFYKKTDVPFTIFTTKVNSKGVRIEH